MMNKVNIIITHKCNLMCKHCYMNAQNSSNEDSDSVFNRFKIIINKIKKMGINEIMITGGECTISPVLFDILNYCNENNIKVTLFTNGFTFNKRICQYVDDYCLSIDGLENSHNWLRGNKNAYNKVLETIKYLKGKNKNITIQTTVTKSNISELIDLSDKLYMLGINRINLCSLLDDGRSIENNMDSHLNLLELKKIITKIYREKGYNLIIHTNIFTQRDTQMYLETNSIVFPLWIDLIDNNFYLIKEDSIFSDELSVFSEKRIKILNDKINSFISKNITNLVNKKYYVLENEILKLISHGGTKNE